MARYPGGKYRPLGTQTESKMSRHNILCFHTMVGSLAGTDNYFRDRGYYGVESHFGVGGSTDGSLDGVTYQWQDTAYGADANLDGKPEVISIETADGGNPDRPWSPKQIDELVKLGIWVCKDHNIPPVLIPDTQPGRRGIGYHRMGCDHGSSYRPKGWPYDKWREPGGVKWSRVLGKVCPGNVRIKQLVDLVIPRIKAGVNGKEDTLSWNEDLTPGTPGNDITKFAHGMLPDNAGRHAADLLGYAAAAVWYLRKPEFIKSIWTLKYKNPFNNKDWYLATYLRYAYYHAVQARREGDAREAKLDAIIAALSAHDEKQAETIRKVLADATVKVDVTVATDADAEQE